VGRPLRRYAPQGSSHRVLSHHRIPVLIPVPLTYETQGRATRRGVVSCGRHDRLCVSAPLRLRVETPATPPRPPSCVTSQRLCHANALPAQKLAHRLRTPHSPSLRPCPLSIRLPCHYEAAPPTGKIHLKRNQNVMFLAVSGAEVFAE
jgi:hypothetical protein